jgi:hypothetical protein
LVALSNRFAEGLIEAQPISPPQFSRYGEMMLSPLARARQNDVSIAGTRRSTTHGRGGKPDDV